MDEEREEGEIVDLNDDDIYENIISSDEELDLRKRIEELEAKNSELEKIASITSINDYNSVGFGSHNFINLVDDDGDNESYYIHPLKYDYSDYTSSQKPRRNRRRKTYRHESKKSKRHKRRKKNQPNKLRDYNESSSDDQFELDRNELQAALKRNTGSTQSSTLKRKLIGVSKTVSDFIKAKDDVAEDDISTSIEIMQLLNTLNVDNIVTENATTNAERDNESRLDEQELRLIALKSAIVKKAEVRKKRKIIETQPYSPTDTDIVMENLVTPKASVNGKFRDELDNMEISPAVSPSIQDGSLQPIDMELESDDENQRDQLLNNNEVGKLPTTGQCKEKGNFAGKNLAASVIAPVPDKANLSTTYVPEENNPNKSFDSTLQRKQKDEEEEQALRASLLANLMASKKKTQHIRPQLQKQPSQNSLENNLSDASLEAELLRNQVFTSLQKGRPKLVPNPLAIAQKISEQVPKPIEMTMPEITSNLKEALKRINEKRKKTVDCDPVLNERIIEVNEREMQTKHETVVDTENSISRKSSILNLKESVTLNDELPPEFKSKMNNVAIKIATSTKPFTECKTKDTNIPLVTSNKIETSSLEKNDDILRSLKPIALNKSTTEPVVSLNQKENQQLQKVIVSPKRCSEEKLVTVYKKAKLNNTKVSKIITTHVEKKVNKLVIQLNNSDTESDDVGIVQNTASNEKSYSGVASPVSYTFSPESPINLIDNKTNNAIESTNASFQKKLDEYLKTARTKVEHAKKELKHSIKKSPLVVSHLPPSSQLEYRTLLNRMALLEKRRSQKIAKITAAVPKPSTKNISVTITNDLFHDQEEKSECQKLEINLDRTTSSKENNMEKAHHINSENNDCSKVSTISAITVNTVRANRDVESKPNVPEPKKASTKILDKSINNFQNFSALSVDDKKNLLQKTELEYKNHSTSYMIDLNDMSSLVSMARHEKENQFQLESHIANIKSKLEQLEQDLAKQKIGATKLLTVISTSHKNIMKKRSQSLQLQKKCYYVGKVIEGADYKIPDDPKGIIAEKIKSLSSKTKLLKNMKKVFDSTTIGSSIRTDCENHTPLNHIAAMTKDIEPVSTKTSAAIQEEPSKTNCTLPDIPIKFSAMTEYRSPLDHMKNITVSNPDSVVCPFQLLGQCEDKECTYQHLS